MSRRDRSSIRAFRSRGTPAVGVYDDGVLIATRDAHLYDPDILHTRYHKLTEWPDLRLLTSRSANGMFAYARWQDGRMQRCISVNAVAGVWRNDGAAEAFEGNEAVSDDRWLDLCNGALASVLSLEGDAARPVSNAVDWEDVGLHVFAR
ncbi:DUF6928 family protein [Gordonia humi]|uniref:DUF6928 family protein n=1 Tax=Gordonia humi TaxID=686429 RepID=UPI0036119252